MDALEKLRGGVNSVRTTQEGEVTYHEARYDAPFPKKRVCQHTSRGEEVRREYIQCWLFHP